MNPSDFSYRLRRMDVDRGLSAPPLRSLLSRFSSAATGGDGDAARRKSVFLLLVNGGAGWDRQMDRSKLFQPTTYDSTLVNGRCRAAAAAPHAPHPTVAHTLRSRAVETACAAVRRARSAGRSYPPCPSRAGRHSAVIACCQTSAGSCQSFSQSFPWSFQSVPREQKRNPPGGI
eukprot:COSAG02_NODE_12997_length_1462_cov_103.550990_3_plen_174_part_00